MKSTKIQEFDLDPNCGFAKEETAQEILGAVGNVAQQEDVQEILEKISETNATLFPSNDEIKETESTTITHGLGVSGNAYYKVYSFIPKSVGAVRVKYDVTNRISKNNYTGNSSSSVAVTFQVSNNLTLYEMISGTTLNGQSLEAQQIVTCDYLSIGKNSTYPVGSSVTSSGYFDVDVEKGIPVTILVLIPGNTTFSSITVTADIEVNIAYKGVAW